MCINEDKSQIIHFRPPKHLLTKYVFKLGNTDLKIVQTYKYLGVHLHEHLDFSVIAERLSSAASRALGHLRYKLRSLKECRYSTFTKLYTSCVEPILDYSAAVWGFKFQAKPEVIQHRAIRYFLGVHRYAANSMIEGDMGWLSCTARRKLAMLNFWNRLVKCSESRLLYKIFTWDISFVNISNSWSYEIYDVMNSLGCTCAFESKTPVDMHFAYKTMLQNEESKWNYSRFEMPKLRYYNLYKTYFETEDYVQANMSKRHRSVLAQFRAGILPLEVETGRYTGKPLEDRICNFCSSNDVEDEYHLLCICNFYSEERNNLYKKAGSVYPDFVQMDDFDKFTCLLLNFQKTVANFLDIALQRRSGAKYKTKL